MSFIECVDRVRNTQLKSFYLLAYRTMALILISSGLLFLICWACVMVFFMFNGTWIAPTILSTTSDKMLTFNGGYLTVAQQASLAQVGHDQALRQVEILTLQKAQLAKLVQQSKTAFENEIDYDGTLVSRAKALVNERASSLRESEELRNQLAEVNHTNQELLAAHLITQDVASQTAAAIQGFRNSMVDGKTALFGLTQQSDDLGRKRSTLLGSAHSVDEMSAVKASADITQAVLQNGNDLATAKATAIATQQQLDLANETLETLNKSAYLAAKKRGSNLAFVPYENQSIAKVGESVYGCTLLIIVCHKIGTIGHIYQDEQLIDFPLFNIKLSRTVRGFMVNMDVTDAAAMRSSVLFVGKPLFF